MFKNKKNILTIFELFPVYHKTKMLESFSNCFCSFFEMKKAKFDLEKNKYLIDLLPEDINQKD